jgi:hypothetical protein
VLFHGAGADVEFLGDLLIAAALHEQIENLLIARSDVDFI